MVAKVVEVCSISSANTALVLLRPSVAPLALRMASLSEVKRRAAARASSAVPNLLEERSSDLASAAALEMVLRCSSAASVREDWSF